MMHKALIAAALLAAPGVATAAPLSIFEATGEALLSGDIETGLTADFFDLDGDDTDLAVSGDTLGGPVMAALLISDANSGATLLESSTVVGITLDLVDAGVAGPGRDRLRVQFGGLRGAAAGQFDATAIVTFEFFEEDGADLTGVDVSVGSAGIAPIPVPASLPLLAGALCFGVIALRRRG